MSETEQDNLNEQDPQAGADEAQPVKAPRTLAELKAAGELKPAEAIEDAEASEASGAAEVEETEEAPAEQVSEEEPEAEETETVDVEPESEEASEIQESPADEESTEQVSEEEPEAEEASEIEENPVDEESTEQVSEEEPAVVAEEALAEQASEEGPVAEEAEEESAEVEEAEEAPAEQVSEEVSPEPKSNPEPQATPQAVEPADQASPVIAEAQDQVATEDEASSSDEPGRPQASRMRTMQVLLVANTVLLAILAFVLLKDKFDSPQQSIANQQPVLTQPHELADVAVPKSDDEPIVVTFAEAEQLFQEGYYDIALLAYRELIGDSLSKPNEAITRELLRLRAAQCLLNSGQDTQANKLFEALTKSPSPIIRGTAEYHMALICLDQGLHMQARMRSYRALSSLNTAGQSGKLALDCDHLMARSLTEKTLRYFNTNTVIPWQNQSTTDLFAGLNKAEIKSLLQSGWTNMSSSIIGPEIYPVQTDQPGPRWSIFSDPLALEELLGKISAATGCPIEWVNASSAVRRRVVLLELPSVTTYRAIELAVGMAGLIVRFDGEKAFVYDPDSLATIQQQQDLLSREAVSAWRRFFLRGKNDKRNPIGHLAIACIYESKGDINSAIREFQTIASRFLGSPSASTALQRSARLRIEIQNFPGARKDLLTLLDSDPNPPTDGQIYLDLGQATLRGGLFLEASDIFRRLYYRDLSPQSQAQACLGLARCFYQQNQFEDAAEWFDKYIETSRKLAEHISPDAFLLLGRSNESLAKTDEALAAYKSSLASGPTDIQRTDALLGIARVHETIGRPIKGIGALKQIRTDQITQANRLEMVILTSRMYRQLSLPEKAIKAINVGAVDIVDTQMQTDLKLELARCKVQQGYLAEAHQLLGEILPSMNPGPQAHQVAYELANLCVQVNRPKQAIIISKGLLERTEDQKLKKQTLDVLGKAYLAMNDYEQAAAAFTGVYENLAGATEQ